LGTLQAGLPKGHVLLTRVPAGTAEQHGGRNDLTRSSAIPDRLCH
jgi:hypothetical protein